MTKTILIADDDDDIVELLTVHCERLGLTVDSANNAMTALGKIEENPPDIALLDVDMPCGDGLSVREMMAGHEELNDIPVIMLTGNTSREVVRRCHEKGAYYVLKCPDVWPRIEPLLRELLPLDDDPPMAPVARQTRPETHSTDLMDAVFEALGVDHDAASDDDPEGLPAAQSAKWVLSIEDDDDVASALSIRLQELGISVVRACEGRAGYRRAFMDPPSAILLDYELPHGNGDYVLRRLKETPATSKIPVIVITGRREPRIERQMRALGANDFLTKPFDWPRLRAAIELVMEKPIAHRANRVLAV